MDEDVFRGKLKQYKDTVYRIAFTYLRNQADAEDVAQETFLKFYLRENRSPMSAAKGVADSGDAERLPQPPAVGLVSESGGTAGKSGDCV